MKSGDHLGPYEIQGLVGSGGMGDVYRARDTRLDRTVAIKVLPPHVAATPDRRARFEREARVVSSLQHPHICVLYDIGQQAPAAAGEPPIDYLVMEFLDGETLADRMRRKPLGLDETVRIASETAGALAAAHRSGVVHRDLKPGNVMLTKAGAKLLDFGLAKPVGFGGGTSASPAFTAAPTVLADSPAAGSPVTVAGTVLGTVQYMSPEQVQGLEADARSDIFAFGALLYEMLAGKPPFEGKTQLSVASAILEKDPPAMASREGTVPPALDRLVRTCLAKDPDARFQSAHDVVLQLQWATDATSPATASERRSAARRVPAFAWVAGAAALTAVASLATWALTRSPARPQSGLTIASIDLAGTPFSQFGSRNLAVSPDGSRVVFQVSDEARSQLYVRRLDRASAEPLAGTEDAQMPFFSPDGQWVAFLTNGKMQKVPISGGGPSTICAGVAQVGASWGDNDTIVFTRTDGLYAVPAAGGEPRQLTKVEGEANHRWPFVLPGSRAALFAANAGASWSEASIELVRLDTGARSTVATGGTSPLYVAPGYVLYARDRTLLALPFDLDTLAPTGQAAPVLDDVSVFGSDGRIQFDVAPTGTAVYLPAAAATPRRSLVLVGRDGRSRLLPLPERSYERPRFSPDGRRVALTIRNASDIDIWVAELARGTLTRITTQAGEDESPVWSADGERLAYAATVPGQGRRVFVRPSDGSGAESLIGKSEGHNHLASWSRDGTFFIGDLLAAKSGIYRIAVEGGAATPVLVAPSTGSRLSPDGRWVAYASPETGRMEVYVQALDGATRKVQVSTAGGSEPVWSPAGRELFYREGPRLVAVPFAEDGGLFKPGTARVLFEGQYATIGWGEADYDVSPDGETFIMVSGAAAQATEFRLILNWLDSLKGLGSPR